MGQSQKCGRGRRQITQGLVTYYSSNIYWRGWDFQVWQSEEVGKSTPPQKQLTNLEKIGENHHFSTLKIDQRHRIIWEVFVLEQLLKFSNNSGTLWHPCLRMLPFSNPLPSPVSMEILPGWGDAVRTGTVKEGSLELEQERANGTTNLRLQLWLGEEYSWLRLCTFAAENRGSKTATYSCLTLRIWAWRSCERAQWKVKSPSRIENSLNFKFVPLPTHPLLEDRSQFLSQHWLTFRLLRHRSDP